MTSAIAARYERISIGAFATSCRKTPLSYTDAAMLAIVSRLVALRLHARQCSALWLFNSVAVGWRWARAVPISLRGLCGLIRLRMLRGGILPPPRHNR
jgi:hypothetical protein